MLRPSCKQWAFVDCTEERVDRKNEWTGETCWWGRKNFLYRPSVYSLVRLAYLRTIHKQEWKKHDQIMHYVKEKRNEKITWRQSHIHFQKGTEDNKLYVSRDGPLYFDTNWWYMSKHGFFFSCKIFFRLVPWFFFFPRGSPFTIFCHFFLCRYTLNTDTRLLWTVLFVATKNSYVFSYFSALNADTG